MQQQERLHEQLAVPRWQVDKARCSLMAASCPLYWCTGVDEDAVGAICLTVSCYLFPDVQAGAVKH